MIKKPIQQTTTPTPKQAGLELVSAKKQLQIQERKRVLLIKEKRLMKAAIKNKAIGDCAVTPKKQQEKQQPRHRIKGLKNEQDSSVGSYKTKIEKTKSSRRVRIAPLDDAKEVVEADKEGVMDALDTIWVGVVDIFDPGVALKDLTSELVLAKKVYG